MTPAEIARALGGAQCTGRGWLCRCVAHDDRTPSLSICDGDDGKLLVKCFAGCDPRDILVALRHRGLLGGEFSAANVVLSLQPRRKPDSAVTQRSAHARTIWRKAVSADGTPVEYYLRSRGYDGAIPATLRAALNLKHSGSGRTFPAMVAAVAMAQ